MRRKIYKYLKDIKEAEKRTYLLVKENGKVTYTIYDASALYKNNSYIIHNHKSGRLWSVSARPLTTYLLKELSSCDCYKLSKTTKKQYRN